MCREMSGKPQRFGWWRLLAFAGPGFPATMLIAPVFGVLPSYYAVHTQVTMADVGWVFLIARLLDALVDPVVGILSDRTRSRLGPRLPWLIGGGCLALPSVYFLFLPPGDAGAGYFFVTSTLAMLAWTLLTIPHNAWAAELTEDYNERSRIFGIKNVVAAVGGFGFFLLPPLLAPWIGTTEINETTMGALVVALCLLIPMSLLWAATMAPGRNVALRRTDAPRPSLLAVLRSISGNPPFLYFVAITVTVELATSMNAALALLYVQDYLGLGADFFLLGILPAVAGIIAAPLWVKLSGRLGKQKAWAIGLFMAVLISLPVLFLQPGAASLVPLLVIATATGAMQGVAIPSFRHSGRCRRLPGFEAGHEHHRQLFLDSGADIEGHSGTRRIIGVRAERRSGLCPAWPRCRRRQFRPHGSLRRRAAVVDPCGCSACLFVPA